MLFTDGDGREKFCHQRRDEVSKNASVMAPIKTASIMALKRLFLPLAKDGRPIYSTTTTDDGHKWFKEVQSSPGEERELRIPTLYDHKTRSKDVDCQC